MVNNHELFWGVGYSELLKKMAAIAIRKFQVGDNVNIDRSGFATVLNCMDNGMYTVQLDGTDHIFHVQSHRLRLEQSSVAASSRH